MPIDTDLSADPYYDDYTPNSDFYGVLFKPSVPVQVRELNQLQSILRRQVELFGDSIYQTGTIVSGCSFVFYPTYPFAKVLDATLEGGLAVPDLYVGLFARELSSNLQAVIVGSAQGLESTAPDLNTLYVAYRNAGTNSNTHQFSLGSQLVVYDSNVSIWGVTVNNGGLGFSNTDAVVFTPAVAVNTTSGTFSNGDYVTQPSTGANLQVVSIDSSSLATLGQIVLSLKPRDADLANGLVNASAWSVANNDSIRNSGNTAVGTVLGVYGGSAAASLTTDGSGTVLSVAVTSGGVGYDVVPTTRVRSVNNASGLSSLILNSRNWLATLTTANTAGSVGNAYAFGVGDGIIYQKGVFQRVAGQTIVVDKYGTTPDGVSVGFNTTEALVNSDVDSTLLDNTNQAAFAPGADRLKLTPVLNSFSSDTTSPDLLRICSWSEGNPFRQNQTPQYSAVGDEMARRMSDAEGDFVLDQFQVTTRSPFVSNNEGNTFSIVVDPGKAYIDGYRVETHTNFVLNDRKGTDTLVSNNKTITLNYGSWVEVDEVGGVFQFSTADTVVLYDTATKFITSGGSSLSPSGTQVGTARARMMVHDSGEPGTSAATWRLYLFNIKMSVGRSFGDVRSIAYPAKGICDVVTQLDATTSAQRALLQNVSSDSLIFPATTTTMKNANGVTYFYRTVDQTVTCSNAGVVTKSLVGSSVDFFGSAGAQSTDASRAIYVVPTGNNLIFTANVAGTVSCNTTSPVVNGSSTTFASDLQMGDWVQVFQNSTSSSIRQVVSIANNTQLTLNSNTTVASTGLPLYRCYPQYVPIPLGYRLPGPSANCSANASILTINVGSAIQGAVSVNCAIAVDIKRTGATPGVKVANRDYFVKLSAANNSAGTLGPWPLGVSDVFRLKNVFTSTASTVNAASRNVTSYFYVDHEQNEDYYDISVLKIRPTSGYVVGASDWLLVQFDYMTVSTPGYFTSTTYVSSNAATAQATDSLTLANLGSSLNSFEVPEVYTTRGNYYDLLKVFDFRPEANATATPVTNAAAAPVNPANTLSFGNTADPTNDLHFPLPDSAMTCTLEQYMGRLDCVYVASDGNIFAVPGTPTMSRRRPSTPPSGAMHIADVVVPPYPGITQHPSASVQAIITTNVANEKMQAFRAKQHTIRSTMGPKGVGVAQAKGYTAQDVGALDRRISALEYYNGLTLLESDVTNRVVPSSVDPTTDRFKFGLFADDFSSSVSLDWTNPQYAASVQAGRLTAPRMQWATTYGPTRLRQPQWVDCVTVSQNTATVDLTVNAVVNATVNSASANAWLLRTDRFLTAAPAISPGPNRFGIDPGPAPNQPVLIDTATFSAASNTSGTVSFYFHVPPTVSVGGIDPDNFLIYQGQTLLKNAASDAVSLTSADQSFLTSNSVPAGWFGSTTFATLGHPATGWVNGSGKVTWTHNPAAGPNYTVVSSRQGAYDHWIWGVNYPVDVATIAAPKAPTPGSTPVYSGLVTAEPPCMVVELQTVSANVIGFIASTRPGQIQAIGPGDTGWSQGTDDGVVVQPAAGGLASGASAAEAEYNSAQLGGPVDNNTGYIPQRFTVTARGLRPSTTHAFTIHGIDKGFRCRPSGGSLGDPLTTDSTGSLVFDWYFDGNNADQDIENLIIDPSSQYATTGRFGGTGAAGPLALFDPVLPMTAASPILLTLTAPYSTGTYLLSVAVDPAMTLNFYSSQYGQI